MSLRPAALSSAASAQINAGCESAPGQHPHHAPGTHEGNQRGGACCVVRPLLGVPYRQVGVGVRDHEVDEAPHREERRRERARRPRDKGPSRVGEQIPEVVRMSAVPGEPHGVQFALVLGALLPSEPADLVGQRVCRPEEEQHEPEQRAERRIHPRGQIAPRNAIPVHVDHDARESQAVDEEKQRDASGTDPGRRVLAPDLDQELRQGEAADRHQKIAIQQWDRLIWCGAGARQKSINDPAQSEVRWRHEVEVSRELEEKTQ
mmetsp:Transcript_52868/g.136526  ORF Transcript_52868/g.136526 Transcript_52868/m.136526 type:complete len:262 (-) Transcript_52868:94-879(-)